MPCPGCERRRREMALMLEAGKQWTKNPMGPNIHEIYTRLHNEAHAIGYFDDLVRPDT
jgi:hypothetical protein